MSKYMIMFITVWVACAVSCIATKNTKPLELAVGMTFAIWLVWVFH